MTEPRQMVFKDAAPSDTSDGYHTFDDLYDHRRALTAALAACLPSWSIRTRQHHPSDETPMFDGCFLVVIDLPGGQVRYHYGLDHWTEFDHVREVDHAPLYDETGPADTIRILNTWAAATGRTLNAGR